MEKAPTLCWKCLVGASSQYCENFREILLTSLETGLANNSAAATAAARRIDSGPAAPLLRDLETQLTFLRGGPGLRYFLTYANSTGLARLLSSKRTYTLLAPVDEAFQRWHPIDWGFNPFLVEAFLEELMANLVIEGAVSLDESDRDGELRSYSTLGGGEVRLRTKGENLYLEDSLVLGEDREDSLVLGDLPLGAGTVLFLDRVPGLDQTRLELLRQSNRCPARPRQEVRGNVTLCFAATWKPFLLNSMDLLNH